MGRVVLSSFRRPRGGQRTVIEPKDAFVIIVDDDPDILFIERQFVKEAGVGRCETRGSGWQAIDLARSGQKVDLILLDIGLAYEDGCDVVRKIKADPELRETLVVAVTANTQTDDMKRAREAGCDGFIGKPLNPVHFPDQIRRILWGESVWVLR
jgi:two-component system cell cycle response regulator DivK